MVTFVYLIFLLFKQVNFCKELRTSGAGWLHDSILSPPSFLGRIKDLKCRMVTFVYLISTFFFQHFLPGIISLRCRMVTFFYLSFTFFFDHFLQGTMDLRHRLTTSPQRHLANSLQTACGHLTIFTFPPLSVEYRAGGFGGGVRGDGSLTDAQPPQT